MPQTGPLPGRATLASPDLAKVVMTHMTRQNPRSSWGWRSSWARSLGFRTDGNLGSLRAAHLPRQARCPRTVDLCPSPHLPKDPAPHLLLTGRARLAWPQRRARARAPRGRRRLGGAAVLCSVSRLSHAAQPPFPPAPLPKGPAR